MKIGKYGQCNDIPGFCSIYAPKVNKTIYQLWHNCIVRGRDYEWQKQNPCYIGCYTVDEVLVLSSFVNWIEQEPRFKEFCETYDKIMWSIDKDIKCDGNKTYAFKYMTLLPLSENVLARIDKHGSPMKNTSTSSKVSKSNSHPIIGIPLDDSSNILVYNSLREARKDNFDPTNISRVCRKMQNQYKKYNWHYLNIIKL